MLEVIKKRTKPDTTVVTGKNQVALLHEKGSAMKLSFTSKSLFKAFSLGEFDRTATKKPNVKSKKLVTLIVSY